MGRKKILEVINRRAEMKILLEWFNSRLEETEDLNQQI